MGIAIGIGIGFGSAGDYWASYWEKQTDVFLFFGQIKNISNGQLLNEMSGSSDALTVAGSAGSYTFQCPNNATYIAADTDYIWFKTDTSQRTPTEAELIGYDFPRTPVKYDDADPYSIRWIGILKSGATLTATQLNYLHKSFYLHTLWSGVINGYGHIKGNKMAQTLWIPETIAIFYDTFTDTNGTLITAHTPNIDIVGTGWNYSTGYLKISGNQLCVSDAGAARHCTCGSGKSDIDISMDVYIPDELNYLAALIVRKVNKTMYWRIAVARAAGGDPIVRISKYTTAVSTAIISHVAGVGNLRCVTNGVYFDVYWKGNKVIDAYTSDGTGLTEKNHGIYLYVEGDFKDIRVDNFQII